MMKSKPDATSLAKMIVPIACLGYGATPAFAQTTAGADVSLSAKVSTNPYNQPQQQTDGAAIAGTVNVDPWIRSVLQKTTVELRGRLRYDKYSKQYGDNDSTGVDLTANHRASDNIRYGVGASFLTSRNSTQDLLQNLQLPQPDQPLVQVNPVLDVGLEGLSRSRNFRVFGTMETKLNERDRINVLVNAQAARYSGRASSEYNSYGGTVDFARTLSERASAHALVSYTSFNYLGRRDGDGRIINPQIGFDYQLGARIQASGSIGASFTNRNGLGGTPYNSTNLTANASVCSRGEKSVTCISGGRSTQPTTLGTASRVTSATFAYTRTLGLRDSLALSASYAATAFDGGPNVAVSNPGIARPTTFVGGSANFRHKVGERLAVFIAPSASKIFDRLSSRRANYQFEGGITYRFGGLR